MSQRTVVFAGAGASKAVNPESYPTTIEFFQRLDESFLKNDLFRFVREYCISRKRDQALVDIEEVMWALAEVETNATHWADASSLVGWMLRKNYLSKWAKGNNTAVLTMIAQDLLPVSRSLTSELNRKVYDLYHREPTLSELNANWIHLFNSLSKFTDQLSIFTTNYDTVIETAIDIMHQRNKWRDLAFGIELSRRPFLDMSNWERHTDSLARVQGGLLTKLHGSVDWSWYGDRISTGNTLWKGDHSRHVILYPGFKGEPDEAPFDLFHEYLALSLSSADCVMFIGFSFRDRFINELIRSRIGLQARIVVLDPAKTLTTPFGPSYDHFQYFEHGFDESGVDDALHFLFR